MRCSLRRIARSTGLFLALGLAGGAAGCAADGALGIDDGGTAPEQDLSVAGPDLLESDLLHLDQGPPMGPGTVDPKGKGGSVNLLAFTSFGDIRPAIPDIDSGYPNDTVRSIMTRMARLNPQFAVASGDYMSVEFLDGNAVNQLKMLTEDEALFTAPIFHAMGNHECQTFSDVNCPNLNETVNLKRFMSTLLPWTPVPWFDFTVHTAYGDAKFVFIAANAWTPAQKAWLETTMAVPTRYTFVLRHQPTPGDSKAVGVTESDPILAKYPVTLFLYGHEHRYARIADNAIISGNAGAPLDPGDYSYGYAYIVQQNDGNVSVTEFKEGTNMPIDNFVLTPEGKQAH